jgi:hypothetical protein
MKFKSKTTISRVQFQSSTSGGIFIILFGKFLTDNDNSNTFSHFFHLKFIKQRIYIVNAIFNQN